MKSPRSAPQSVLQENRLDHFIEEQGEIFAGRHFIVDVWGAERLDDSELMQSFLEKSIVECGATLLHMHMHHFSPNNGLSGVAVLAESHISFHTWPEMQFGAFDVFMCGDTKPHLLVAILEEFFTPQSIDIKELKRGIVNAE